MYYKLLTSITLLGCFVITSCYKPQDAKDSKVLLPPFDVALVRSNVQEPYSKKFRCKRPPEPMKDLFFESMYDKDSKNASEIDPEAYDVYKNDTKPLRTLESGLATTANYYLKSNPPRSEIAECVMAWLSIWGDDNALLGKSSQNGDFLRKWLLSSISLAYLQVKDDPYISPELHEKTKAWIRRITERVIQDFSKNSDKNSRNNNHMYWAAWGVMTAGIVLNDQSFYNWGLYEAKLGIQDIQKNGTLPLELDRGKKAYNYHHFAAIPLFMMAHTADVNGDDLFGLNGQGLQRLGEVILDNMENQTLFEELTDEKQDLTRTITSSNLVWLEIYNKYYPSDNNMKWLTKYRSVKQSRVGGDATLLYSGENY